MAGPGDEIAAGAEGRGHLRASHADREQVIGTLKAAFVQGMLAKDEFDLRVGQALASRTYADLAALTADLPAGLAGTQPPKPARAQGEGASSADRRGAHRVNRALCSHVAAGVLHTQEHGGQPCTLRWQTDLAEHPPLLVRFALRSGCGSSPTGRTSVPAGSHRGGQHLARAVRRPGDRHQPGRAESFRRRPGHQHTAEAAPIRRPRRPVLPGWRPQATTGYLTHPAWRWARPLRQHANRSPPDHNGAQHPREACKPSRRSQRETRQ